MIARNPKLAIADSSRGNGYLKLPRCHLAIRDDMMAFELYPTNVWELHDSGSTRSTPKVERSLVIILLGLISTGCTTLPIHQPRTHDAASWPTKARLRRACVDALRSPGTWVPAAGATLTLVDDWDKKISRWAVEKTPIFGSSRGADEFSDDLRTATHLGMLATALATTGEEPAWKSRLQRLLVEQAGSLININTTNVLKEATGRQRPDASDNASFPSGHSSKAFNYAAFASRNLEVTNLSDAARRGLRIGFFTLAAGTAWARVEGQKHYPSDVLAGAALGHFMALLIHDAFLGHRDGPTVDVQFRRDGAFLGVELWF